MYPAAMKRKYFSVSILVITLRRFVNIFKNVDRTLALITSFPTYRKKLKIFLKYRKPCVHHRRPGNLIRPSAKESETTGAEKAGRRLPLLQYFRA